MPDTLARKRTLYIRLPQQLAVDLWRVAARESNSTSAVARRLIAAGLQRELRTEQEAEPRSGHDGGDAA